MKPVCSVCPHACAPEEGGYGLCRARKNVDGNMVSVSYAKVTALALDPIEKKPLMRFMPGSKIFSVGSFGCNLRCAYCQNNAISMAGETAPTRDVLPEQLVQLAQNARADGNIGIAYTYNEPLVGYEYVRDCTQLARQAGLKNVLVTNGYINTQPLRELLGNVDAMNIDLKAFSQDGYHTLGGDLHTVKRTIEESVRVCHVEVTTLVVPGFNDGEDMLRAQCEWMNSLNPEMPLHLTRFFPQYKMKEGGPTPIETMHRLRDVAQDYLKHVHLGNC